MKKYLVIALYIGAIRGMAHDESSDFELYHSMKSDDEACEMQDEEALLRSFVRCFPGQQELLSNLLNDRVFAEKRTLLARTLIKDVALESRALLVGSKLGLNALSFDGQTLMVKVPSPGILSDREELLVLDHDEEGGPFLNYRENIVANEDQGAVRSFVSSTGRVERLRYGLALDPFDSRRHVPINPNKRVVIVADRITGEQSIAQNHCEAVKIFFHKYIKNILLCTVRSGHINVWQVPDRLGSKPCKNLTCCGEGVDLSGKGFVSSLDFDSRNHAFFTAATTRGFIGVWNMFSGHKIKEWLAHEQDSVITNIVFLPGNENYLISAGEDATVRIWDTNDASCVRIIDDHKNKIESAGIIENLLVTASEDKTVRQWNIENIKKALNWFSHIENIPMEFEVRSPDLAHEGLYMTRSERVNYVIVYLILEQIAQAIASKRKAQLEPYEIAYFSGVFPDWMQHVFRKHIALKKSRSPVRTVLFEKLKKTVNQH